MSSTTTLRTGARIALGIAIASALLASPAIADETRFDASASLYGFSSAGNQYGPWKVGDLRYVNAKGRQALNLELSRRIDNDRLAPTKGTYEAVGYRADLSDRLSGFAQAGFGSSTPFARSTQHLEFDYKASSDKRLVLAIAEDFARYAGNTRTQQTSVGPTVYLGRGVLQLRALVQANTGVRTRTGGLVSYGYMPSRQTTVTATALFGPQGFESVVPGLRTAIANVTGTSASLSLAQMVTREMGVTIGASYSHLTNQASGRPLYTGRGVTLGYFVKQ